MKLALTGASGFIGSHVLRELSRREGLEIVTAGRNAPAPVSSPAQALAGVRHVVLDIARPEADVFAALGHPDLLIHLAWSGLPNYSAPRHVDKHLFEQIAFLDGLVRAGLPSLLCAGTCLEYGLRNGELTEDLEADPQTPYALAKDTLRRQLGFLRRELGFGLTWARLFYSHGDGQAPTSLYAQLERAHREGARSFQMSHGEQLRDYLPVAEVARLLVDLALRAPDAGVVNVCSGRPIAVRSLVEQWIAEQGWRIELERGVMPVPDYEPLAFWGSNRRLRTLLEAR